MRKCPRLHEAISACVIASFAARSLSGQAETHASHTPYPTFPHKGGRPSFVA